MVDVPTTRFANIVAATVVPVIVNFIATVLFHNGPSSRWLGGYGIFLLSSLLGFAFMVRHYRWYSLIVAVAYFPTMVLILFASSLVTAALVFGDSI